MSNRSLPCHLCCWPHTHASACDPRADAIFPMSALIHAWRAFLSVLAHKIVYPPPCINFISCKKLLNEFSSSLLSLRSSSSSVPSLQPKSVHKPHPTLHVAVSRHLLSGYCRPVKLPRHRFSGRCLCRVCLLSPASYHRALLWAGSLTDQWAPRIDCYPLQSLTNARHRRPFPPSANYSLRESMSSPPGFPASCPISRTVSFAELSVFASPYSDSVPQGISFSVFSLLTLATRFLKEESSKVNCECRKIIYCICGKVWSEKRIHSFYVILKGTKDERMVKSLLLERLPRLLWRPCVWRCSWHRCLEDPLCLCHNTISYIPNALRYDSQISLVLVAILS